MAGSSSSKAPAKPPKPVSVNDMADKTVKDLSFKAYLKFKEKKADGEAILAGEFKRVSPNTYKMLFDIANDYIVDRYDSTAPKGTSVPVEMFLDLPDKTRLRMNYNFKDQSISIRFGTSF